MSLALLLRKTKILYQLEKGKEKINNLLFMYYLIEFPKSKDHLDSLVNSVRIFSFDIRMEFGLSMCAVSIMERGNVIRREGIVMTNYRMLKIMKKEMDRNILEFWKITE